MIKIILAAAAAVVVCAAAASAEAIRTEAVFLDPATPERLAFGRLTYRGGLALSGGEGFGELSALLFDGPDLIAVNDRARWFRLRLRHGANGWLEGAELVEQGLLADRGGKTLASKRRIDSESVARWGGGIVVGFEREHRLWLYAPDLRAAPQQLDAPAEIASLPNNGGIEALAELTDGRLLLISEDGGDEGVASAWIGKPGAWQTFGYKREGSFTPTGAAALPDGGVILTERRFTLVGGFAGRIVVLDPAAITAGGTIGGEELLRFEPPLTVDNFEGIAARDEDGSTVVYVVSDDNMSPLQNTLLMSFIMR